MSVWKYETWECDIVGDMMTLLMKKDILSEDVTR